VTDYADIPRSDYQLTDHQTGVSTQVGPAGQDASFGWCSCGWRGPIREGRDEATEDALTHAETGRRSAAAAAWKEGR
jgi:hypothetical protein